MLAAIFTASLIWSIVQTADAGTVAYYSPLTRAWELAVGATIAFLPVSGTTHRTLTRFAQVIGWLGLAGVLLSAFSYTQQTAFPGYAALLPVLGAGAIIFAGAYDARFSVGKLLSILPLRFIGDISFSLYLWHWPLITIAREVSLTGAISTAATFELLALALALAIATFFLIEQPFRRSSLLRRRGALPSFALGAFLVIAVVGICRIELASHPQVASTTERGVNLLSYRSYVA